MMRVKCCISILFRTCLKLPAVSKVSINDAVWYKSGTLLLISKTLFTVFVLLLTATTIQAQDQEKYLYQDSSVLFPTNDDTLALAADSSIEYDKAIVADTVLINNGLYLSADSVAAIKKEQAFAYAGKLDSLLKDLQLQQVGQNTASTKRISVIDRFFSARLTKILFWTIAALLLSFVIVKLFITEGIFKRKSDTNNVKVLATDDDAAPDGRDYNSLINAAIQKKEYRLATRYLYLQSLYKLIELGAINFAKDKTNHQYLNELAAKPYQQAFAELTLQYDYTWYGGFIVDENKFKSIHQSFKNFINQLPSLH